MGSTNNLPSFSKGCEASTPGQDADIDKCLSRWSNVAIKAVPAAIIVPAVEDDVIAAVKFASENGFKVIPASGTHGAFVPIDERSVYLDMRNFRDVVLNEESSTVKMGGGALTGDVLKTLAERGFYTNFSNSNEVGMLGYVLGGGHSIFTGLHGLAIDNVLAIRIITASGKTLELDLSSGGAEADLFNVLCGAGYGFGVVTSFTLRAFRIKDRGMSEGKFFKRQLIFPPASISAAAELFAKLQTPAPQTAVSLVALRAPPAAPNAGDALIMLFINSLGPADEAEKACAAAFDSEFTSKTIVAKTAFTNFADMNDAAENYNHHGDFKENHAVWSDELSASAIESAFEHWLHLGEVAPSAKDMTSFVIAAKSTEGMLGHDKDGRKFFPRILRERKVFTRVGLWWTDPADDAKAKKWARELVQILGPGAGERVRGFAANLSRGLDMAEVYPTEKLEQIEQLKKLWDPSGVFWNPVVDGW